ncbi:MAG TPA: YdiU family protein [Aquabacterium sp.]|nr:YdiU family protein [Aquabacterium sp.]
MPFSRDAWVNRYASLSAQLQDQCGVSLGTELQGQPLPNLQWVATSEALARELGWPEDWAEHPEALAVFSGNAVWPGMRPMATVYSGHQFGQWAGQLGDGRALLLGEVQTPQGPREVQLKGAGATPYSRRGDGRAVLRSSIREFLCSEAMHALGIPTSRALCLTASPHPVYRETAETAAVVTRVAPSFVRFGHFEHFAHSGRPGHDQALAALVDFVVDHHLPHLAHLPRATAAAGQGERAVALLAHASETTADLMAQWQAVGFCHGVMNTDNMSILGLTLDYGPFGFMDGFDPSHVCNHSDVSGRYRWRYQPDVGFWNIGALAQALAPLIPDAATDDSEAQLRILGAIKRYEQRYGEQMLARWRAKLGLSTEEPDDARLAHDWITLMAGARADFTITFRRLGGYRAALPPEAPENAPVRDLFLDRAAFDAWARRYADRLAREGSVDAERQARMDRVNPWVVLRNHLAEHAIRRAQAGDFSEVQRLHRVLQRPFEVQSEHAADADFPPDWASAIEVSCSS